MECGKQKTTELHEEKSSTTFGEKRVYTQEKIEVIDDIQIKRQRILKSLNNESFKRHFGGGSCQKIYLNCAAVLLKKKTRDPCKYFVRETWRQSSVLKNFVFNMKQIRMLINMKTLFANTHTNTETLAESSHLSWEQSAAVKTEIKEENLLTEKYLKNSIYDDCILKVLLFPFDITETFGTWLASFRRLSIP